MMTRKAATLSGWLAFMLAVLLFAFIVWDYVSTRLESHERRIRELEATARPLVVVDKWAHVYLNGEEVPPPEEGGGAGGKEDP
jgi:hypothetical protein